jgi:hypothetical protein
MKVGFEYGALAEPLEKQARNQGCTLGKDAKKYEQCQKAILTLRFGIDTPDTIHDKLTQRLHSRVIKCVRVIPTKE